MGTGSPSPGTADEAPASHSRVRRAATIRSARGVSQRDSARSERRRSRRLGSNSERRERSLCADGAAGFLGEACERAVVGLGAAEYVVGE